MHNVDIYREVNMFSQHTLERFQISLSKTQLRNLTKLFLFLNKESVAIDKFSTVFFMRCYSSGLWYNLLNEDNLSSSLIDYAFNWASDDLTTIDWASLDDKFRIFVNKHN